MNSSHMPGRHPPPGGNSLPSDVGCREVCFVRLVYGIEIEFAWTRRRPIADFQTQRLGTRQLPLKSRDRGPTSSRPSTAASRRNCAGRSVAIRTAQQHQLPGAPSSSAASSRCRRRRRLKWAAPGAATCTSTRLPAPRAQARALRVACTVAVCPPSPLAIGCAEPFAADEHRQCKQTEEQRDAKQRREQELGEDVEGKQFIHDVAP